LILNILNAKWRIESTDEEPRSQHQGRRLSLGSGLSKLAGKVFRIGHLGECNELTLMAALSGVEMGLSAAGVPYRAGGVDAAIKALEDPATSNAPGHLKVVKP
jgi:alanine-glyoxylate transaminase/serine-glyoxylate transaminase/serine-pyruvate transaminase